MRTKRYQPGRLSESLHKQIQRERLAQGGLTFEAWLRQQMAREAQYRQQVRLLHAELTRLRPTS